MSVPGGWSCGVATHCPAAASEKEVKVAGSRIGSVIVSVLGVGIRWM